MQGNLTSEEIDKTLHEATHGHLGCHAGGRTYVVPVGYAYDGRRLVLHSTEGEKIRMMRENPHVCFQVEVVEAFRNWRSVVLWGRFVELKGNAAAAALGLLIDRLLPLLDTPDAPEHGMRAVTPPSRAEHLGPSVVYAIDIQERAGRYERLAHT